MTICYHDIVVTGVAAISPAGVGTGPLMRALEEGVSRLTPVPEELLGEAGYHWGKAEGFRAADFISPLKARKLDRCSLLAVAATGLALQSARLEPGSIPPSRIGIVLGCGFGGIANAEEFLSGYFAAGAEGLVPMLFPNIVPNASASNASIEYRLKGPNVTAIQRFCSAESAFMMAKRFIEEDRADVVITGGVDEVFPGILKGLKAMGQLGRAGSGFSEGAGLLVLEKGDHARLRKAPVFALVEELRTIGRLSLGNEGEGYRMLLPRHLRPDVVSLSGSAPFEKGLMARLPGTRTIDTGQVLGRSLAMGGLALAALVLNLKDGSFGTHLASSPEGPYYAIDLIGGDPVPF